MTRDCSSLKNGEQVVFNIYSDIYKNKIPETGTVEDVSTERKEVHIHWLEGYKDRHDVVPFEDMIAVYNKDGEMMKWKGISGPSDLLTYEKVNDNAFRNDKQEEKEQIDLEELER